MDNRLIHHIAFPSTSLLLPNPFLPVRFVSLTCLQVLTYIWDLRFFCCCWFCPEQVILVAEAMHCYRGSTKTQNANERAGTLHTAAEVLTQVLLLMPLVFRRGGRGWRLNSSKTTILCIQTMRDQMLPPSFFWIKSDQVRSTQRAPKESQVMPLGTALRKECKQGIQRLWTALRRLIISFTLLHCFYFGITGEYNTTGIKLHCTTWMSWSWRRSSVDF